MAQAMESSQMESSEVMMEDSTGVMRTASWAIQFDTLLGDRAGVATFTAYLKTILCAENINFWMRCEQFKQMSEDQRSVEAMQIYTDHLDPTAQEQVNVDEQTRLMVRGEIFSSSSPNCFDRAQKHIYTLMKENCYKRFLSSDIYKQAVSAEMAGQPFRFSGEPLEAPPSKARKEDGKATKKTKPKEDTTKENRRRSLMSWMPWNSNKSVKESPKKKMSKNDEMFNKALNTPSTTVFLDEKPKEKRRSSGLFDFHRRSSIGPKVKGKSKDLPHSDTLTAIPSMSSSALPKSVTKSSGLPKFLSKSSGLSKSEAKFSGPAQSTMKSKSQVILTNFTRTASVVPRAISNSRREPFSASSPITSGNQQGETRLRTGRKSLDSTPLAHNRGRFDDERAGMRMSMQSIPEFLLEDEFNITKQPTNRSFDNFLDTDKTFSEEQEQWNGQIFPYIDEEGEYMTEASLVGTPVNAVASATPDRNIQSERAGTRLSMQRIPKILLDDEFNVTKQRSNRSFDNFLDTDNMLSVEQEQRNGQILSYIDAEEERLAEPCLVVKPVNIASIATPNNKIQFERPMTSKIPVSSLILPSRTRARCSYRRAIETEKVRDEVKSTGNIGEKRCAALSLPQRAEKRKCTESRVLSF